MSNFDKALSEYSESSKRYAVWSLIISVAAIVTSVIIGGVQIYLAKIQVAPILEQQYRAEKSVYDRCKEPGNAAVIIPYGAAGDLPCSEVYKILKNKFE